MQMVLQPVAFDTTQITSPSNYSRPQPGDPCHPLAAGAHPPAVAFDVRQSCAPAREVAGTLDANYGKGPGERGGAEREYVQQDYRVRRLTPVECERLQGFSDDYTRIPWRGKPAEDCPDGLRYRALGNSMACNVMRWIGRRIEMVEART